MKKQILLILTAALMLLASGCQAKTENTVSETNVIDEESKNTEVTEKNTTDENCTEDGNYIPLKIAVAAGPSGVNDGSFNQDIYDGILAYVEKSPGSTVTSVLTTTEDAEIATNVVSDIVREDYDVVICCGYYFEGIGSIAQKNPNIKFILVDAFLKDDDGNEIELENVYAMQFAEQESGFFAGIAAALETKTDRVAVINGIAYPSNVNYQYGFECGVKYVNETENKNVTVVEMPAFSGTDIEGTTVGGNYIGSFNDEVTGRVLANSLIVRDCDILFVAAGGSGKGVFEAVKYADDVKVIGCDVDQYDDGIFGKENIVLTSALKNMHSNVEKQLIAIHEGSFQGENVILYANTDSTGFVSDSARCQLSKNTTAKLEKAYELIKNGTIVPASNFNGITPDTFTTLKEEQTEQAQ